MDGDLRTELIHLNGDTVLMVLGEVDASTSQPLEEACLHLASRTDRLVIEMSGVSFMDSSGLHVLIDVSRRENTSVLVRNPSPQVRRLLEITDLAAHFLEPLSSSTEVANAGHAATDPAPTNERSQRTPSDSTNRS